VRYGRLVRDECEREGSRMVRTRASKYWFGLAPSGRAKCRTCKQLVEKGEVRLVVLASVCPGRSCKLVHHANCVGSELASAVLTVCGDVNRVLMSDDVSVEGQREIRMQLLNLTS
jgi:hypothetical protein